MDLELSRFSNLKPKTQYELDIDLPCKNIGVTQSDTLSTEVTQYGTETLPTWVTVDVTTGMMTVDTPNLKEDTNYTFYVKVKSSGDEEDQFFKLITLQVIATPEEPLETEPEGRLTM